MTKKWKRPVNWKGWNVQNSTVLACWICVTLLSIVRFADPTAAQYQQGQPRVGPQFELRGLRPQQSEIDDVLAKAFGCPNQHGVKMTLDAGLKPRRCLLADHMQAIFARELALGTNLIDFVRRHHGDCKTSATDDLHCAIERDVHRRSSIADPLGQDANVFESRTIFTVRIQVNPLQPISLKVDLIREDYYGSRTRG